MTYTTDDFTGLLSRQLASDVKQINKKLSCCVNRQSLIFAVTIYDLQEYTLEKIHFSVNNAENTNKMRLLLLKVHSKN